MKAAEGMLALGALLGAVIAALGALGPDAEAPRVPEGAVAIVGGAPIAEEDYRRVLDAMGGDRRALDEAARRHVLDRLIDESLLAQRGVELGLPMRAPRLRAALGDAVLSFIVAQAEGAEPAPSEEALRAHYEARKALFRRPVRARVRQLFFSARLSGGDEAALQRAAEARARVVRGGWTEEAARLGDPPLTPPPDALLTVQKLGDYLGPTLAAAASALVEGQTSPPLRCAGGACLLSIAEVEAGQERPFEEVKALVEADWRKNLGDEAVRRFLEARRREVPIAVRQDLQ